MPDTTPGQALDAVLEKLVTKDDLAANNKVLVATLLDEMDKRFELQAKRLETTEAKLWRS